MILKYRIKEIRHSRRLFLSFIAILACISLISNSREALAIAAPPDAPRNFTVRIDATTATASWSAPASDGGEAIRRFVITARPLSSPRSNQIQLQKLENWRKDVIFNGPSCSTGPRTFSCDLFGLVNGIAYSFSAYATNAIGKSTSVKATTSLESGYISFKNFRIGPQAPIGFINLGKTDLSSLNLDGVRSDGISGSPKLPEGWQILSGHLVGPKADFTGMKLTNIDFQNADLTGANFSGSNLGGSNLSRATLSGVRGFAITGNPMLPPNWRVSEIVGKRWTVGRCLVGPGVDLSYKNLEGHWLVGVNLTGANLTGTYLWNNLSGAILNGANLTSTDLRGANLTGVTATDLFFDPNEPPLLPSGWNIVGGVLVFVG